MDHILAEDWGLLSVADVLDSNVKVPEKHNQTTAPVIIKESVFPVYCGSSTKIARFFTSLLATTLKLEGNTRSGAVEELYQNRSRKMQLSLTASQQIRHRLIRTTEYLAASVSQRAQGNTGFETVALLSSMVKNNSADARVDLFVETINQIDWSVATVDSCLEVFKALQEQLDDSQCSPSKQSLLMSCKMNIVFFSGRLSALLACLLLPGSQTTLLLEHYRPPARKMEVDTIDSNIEGFLTRNYRFPFHINRTKMCCIPKENSLIVCCGNTLCELASMGMMGSRMKKEVEHNAVSLEKGEYVLVADNHFAITAKLTSSENSRFVNRFRELDVVSGKEKRKGSVIFDCSNLTTRNVHLTLAEYKGEVACLVSSTAPMPAQHKLYVTPNLNLDRILSTPMKEGAVVDVASSNVLLRNPVPSKHTSALHFMKGTCISVGRITLKDRFAPFCIEFWVYPRNCTDRQTIISIGNKKIEDIVIEVVPTSDGILWRGGCRIPDRLPSFTRYSAPGKSIFSEKWWHVALNFTGSMWELWLDDHFVSRSPAEVRPDPIEDAAVHLGHSFVGFLSEVRVWNVSRNATELFRDARRRISSNEERLLVYFPLSEGRGDLITDYSRHGQHTLLNEGTANWYEVPYLPIAEEEETLIPDFVPMARCSEYNTLFFALTPLFYTVASCSQKGNVVILFHYSRKTSALLSQMHIDLSGNYFLKGVTFNEKKASLLCYGYAKENTNQLTLWDVHSQSVVPLSFDHDYTHAWECGRDILSHAATYARKFVEAERFLADQSSWKIKLPEFVIDSNDNLVASLLQCTKKALEWKDMPFAENCCLLLHINLFFQYEVNPSKLLKSVGDAFSSAEELLEVLQSVSKSCSIRDEIVRISFMNFCEETQLLRMCCHCFLNSKSRIAFLNNFAGKVRSDAEEKLLLHLINYYSTLQACSSLLESPEQSQIFYCALIREAVFQVDRCLTDKGPLVLRRTSRCMEVFQEILFLTVTEKAPASPELIQLAIHYSKTLLRACGKTVDAIVKALRKCPTAEKPLLECLERSHVGSLLPSFSFSLPVLPRVVLAACPLPIQSCRETLSSLRSMITLPAEWISSVGISLIFSLSLIACSLIDVEPEPNAASPTEESFPYLDLLRAGKRKSGSERDVLIKNLQQGVGAISKVFEELQKRDHTALRVVRDEKLKRMERHIMASFCALITPTKDLREASRESLEPAFRNVLQMRPWVLSKRQESKEYVAQVEARACFLSQFECCCRGGSDTAAASRTSKSKEVTAHHKWKRFFRNWKAMRLQKALMSSQENTDQSRISKMIIEFLQSDRTPEEPEQLIALRTKKAKHRLSGLLLMKQLVEEARVSAPLASIVLPVFAKAVCAWHYADGVDCCPSEEIFRLHGAYFQFFDAVLAKYIEEGESSNTPWGILLSSLFTADMRPIDFRHMHPEITSAFRSLWAAGEPGEGYSRRSNSFIESTLRETRLTAELAAQSMTIGVSGLTVKSQGGQGTCVAPCTWRSNSNDDIFYYEVYVVDMLPGTTCSVGVGKKDYSLTRLPGWDPSSYALQSDEGVWFGNGKIRGYRFTEGDVIGCGWNVEQKKIFWTKNGVFLVATDANQDQLSPLIGFNGRGTAKVNFGEEPFVYTEKLYNNDLCPPSLRHTSWDAFRIFSIRASLCLKQSSSVDDAPMDSIKQLASCVQFCFDTLAQELTGALMETQMSYEGLQSLFSHTLTLSQLLDNVPKHIVSPCVSSMTVALEKASTIFLTSAAAANDTIAALLMSWFNCMNLSPPDATLPPQTEGNSGKNSAILLQAYPSGFLSTLIRLAGRLFVTASDSSDQSYYFGVMPLLRNNVEELSTLALALLQRMNQPFTLDGKAVSTTELKDDAKTSVHAWVGALHEWLTGTLKACETRASTEVMVALGILGGCSRIAVCGDHINILRSSNFISRGTLLSCSFAEEICEIVDEDGALKTIPLRLSDIIIDEGENNYFPVVNYAHHQRQAKEVLSLALRVLRTSASDDSESAQSAAALNSLLLSILWRSAVRGAITFGKEFLLILYHYSADFSEEQTPMDIRQLRSEKVVTDWMCTAALQSAYDQLARGPAKVSEEGDKKEELLPELLMESPSTIHEHEGGGDPLEHIDMGHFSSNSINADGTLLGNSELDGRGRFLNDDLEELMSLEDGEEEMDEDEEEYEEEEDEDEEESTDSEEINMGYINEMEIPSGSDDMVGDSFQLVFPEYEEDSSSDTIHFERGCLCISSPRPVGNKYTIEMFIRPVIGVNKQTIFMQDVSTNELSFNMRLVGRLSGDRLEFGLAEFIGGRVIESSDEWMCKTPLVMDDPGRFIRTTFVQFGTTLSLYCDGILRDTTKIPFSGSLLQKELMVGGTPEDYSSSFIGEIRGFRLYEVHLEPNMVDQLYSLNSSLAMLLDSRLCVKLRAKRQNFHNASKSPAAITVDITPHGDVWFLEHSTRDARGDTHLCAQELDFSCDLEEKEPYTIGTLHALTQNSNAALIWKRKEGMSSRVLFSSRRRLGKMLSEFYSISILSEVLCRSEQLSLSPTALQLLRETSSAPTSQLNLPSILSESATLNEVTSNFEGAKRIISYTLLSGSKQLYELLQKTLHNMTTCLTFSEASSTPSYLVSLGNETIKHLLHISQREQLVRVYESTHPYRSTVRSTHGVMMMGQRYYQLYFDARCTTSDTYFTFAADQNMCDELAQFPGYALTPFVVPLPRLFFNVRCGSGEPQWGYRVIVVFDCRPQLLAMWLFRSFLSFFLQHSREMTVLPFLFSRDCITQLGNCAKVNTGKVRLLALSCLTDLLLHSDILAPRSLHPSPFSSIHEIRRTTERRYRKYMSNQMVHSRFLQVVSECYLCYTDGQFCSMERKEGEPTAEMNSREEFVLRRQQQRTLYSDRDREEHVKVYKIQEPHNLKVEWNAERICVVKSDDLGGAIIAARALTAGVWYYELRIGGPGEVYIGVLPTRGGSKKDGHHYVEGLTDGMLKPIAYNGRGERYRSSSDRIETGSKTNAWRYQDHVGVVLNVPERTCSMLVNGEDCNLHFSFSSVEEEDSAVTAQTEELSFCPYFAFEGTETFFFNFGGAHFEFEPPRGCFPLDPLNFMLGTLIPYNQIRAFQDLGAHLLTGGLHPMPPFWYEEPDPFEGCKERSGPAYVSLHGVEGVQINGLEVKNVGIQFSTVAADCCVSGGAWYYEVTLRSQGLMQIGWAVKSELRDGSVGDMPSSWSIDLFRMLKWYNGKSEPVTVPRRWNAGDVIGCALDLNAREMNFYLNGRRISSGMATFRYLPQSVEYVPAISLRAGNHVTFNFGSANFHYKPEGFQALGIPDSWCERMDTYYSNEGANSILRRQRVLKEIWKDHTPLHAKYQETLRLSRVIVKAVDGFGQETGKSYSQITESLLQNLLEKQGCTAPSVLQGCWEHFGFLNYLARVCLVVVPFLSINTKHYTATTKLFLIIRTVLFRAVRGGLVIAMLRETNVRKKEQLCVSINRRLAGDPKGVVKNTMFGQTLSVLGDRHPRMFQTHKRVWATVFLGEGADDAGGPYREHISGMCRELMSPELPFFVPTANNTVNTGTYREAYVPAAGATSAYDVAAFTFVGRLMGSSMRRDEPLGLYFPPLVWKYMCHYPIGEEDLSDIDLICVQCIAEFRSIASQGRMAAEEFEGAVDAEFVTQLSDHSRKELIPGGESIKVTFDRCREYAERLLECRLHEFDHQLHYMREGLLSVVPEASVLLYTPTELEQKICGKADYQVEELRKGTLYDGITANDRRVQFLWKALEEATPTQRRLFLRFVSGRERLPVKLRIMPLSMVGDPDDMMPHSATCFFALELPNYSSLEVMKQKLYYSIENCVDMDKDFNDFSTQMMDDGEGPRVEVRSEEGHDDGTATFED